MFCLFLVVGGSLAIYGYNTLQWAQESEDWPTVTATVLNSGVGRTSSGSDSNSPSYYAFVTYEYVVDGTTYQGNEVKVGISEYSLSENEARAFANIHPPDSEIEVYYDPANPEKTAIFPGPQTGHYLFLTIGSIFAFVGLAGLIVSIIKPPWASTSSILDIDPDNQDEIFCMSCGKGNMENDTKCWNCKESLR